MCRQAWNTGSQPTLLYEGLEDAFNLDKSDKEEMNTNLTSLLRPTDALWADQLCSAACCLLGAYDGLEAQSILNQLVHEPDAVLANSDVNTCFVEVVDDLGLIMFFHHVV